MNYTQYITPAVSGSLVTVSAYYVVPWIWNGLKAINGKLTAFFTKEEAVVKSDLVPIENFIQHFEFVGKSDLAPIISRIEALENHPMIANTVTTP